jgi:hypothetical protein
VFPNILRDSFPSATDCVPKHITWQFSFCYWLCSQTHYVTVFLLLLIVFPNILRDSFPSVTDCVPTHSTCHCSFSHRSTICSYILPPHQKSQSALHIPSYLPLLPSLHTLPQPSYIAVLSYLSSQFSWQHCLSHWLQNFRLPLAYLSVPGHQYDCLFLCLNTLIHEHISHFKPHTYNLNYMYRPSPYRAVNTLRLCYKNQTVNVV